MLVYVLLTSLRYPLRVGIPLPNPYKKSHALKKAKLISKTYFGWHIKRPGFVSCVKEFRLLSRNTANITSTAIRRLWNCSLREKSKWYSRIPVIQPYTFLNKPIGVGEWQAHLVPYEVWLLQILAAKPVVSRFRRVSTFHSQKTSIICDLNLVNTFSESAIPRENPVTQMSWSLCQSNSSTTFDGNKNMREGLLSIYHRMS